MSEKNDQSDENLGKNLKSVNENASWEDQVQKLKDEISMLKDTVLRKMAESENFRKRLEKEKEEAIKYSNAKFAKDLLAVLDNFERVAENSVSIKEKIETDDNLKAFFDGIELCEKELVLTFKKHGIYRTEVKEGDKFDPGYHQAMCELDSPDHKTGVIIKVFQTGYTYNDRLLRPAMVSVSKKA